MLVKTIGGELADSETSMTAANDLAIRRALELAGVEFIDENGGGPRGRLSKRQRAKWLTSTLVATSTSSRFTLPRRQCPALMPLLNWSASPTMPCRIRLVSSL